MEAIIWLMASGIHLAWRRLFFSSSFLIVHLLPLLNEGENEVGAIVPIEVKINRSCLMSYEATIVDE